jgi:hypothetical protein
MGTFIGKANAIIGRSEVGAIWSVTPGGATSDAALLAAIQGISIAQGIVANATPNTMFISFSIELFLDGGVTPILSANDLPPGFTVTSLDLVARIGNDLSAGVGAFALEFVPAESIDISGTTGASPIYTYTIPHALPVSNIHLFSEQIGFESQFPGGAGSVNTSLYYIILQGTYDLIPFQWTLDPISGSNVDIGDLVTITSDPNDPDHLLLDQLTISMSCGTVVPIIQTETLFTFLIPGSCTGNGSTSITATGNGTQFSGSVSLGTLNILLTNGSGIYVLTPGATHDTLYSSLRDGTTRNVKIPNPFAKTGFIGG